MANEFVDTTLLDGFADGPHITEKQVGLVNQGTYGPDDYVLETGRQAEAQILTNNSIRIFDAVYVIQGRRDAIAANDYTDVSIDNGAQGMNRNDIIVRRYEKDESSEIESVSYAVIKGTPNEGPAADPDVTEGDIRSGATLHEMKLYRVKLEGLNIVAVEPLFSVLMNMSTLNAYLSQLSSKIPEEDNGYLKFVDGTLIQWGSNMTNNTNAVKVINLQIPFINNSYFVTYQFTRNANTVTRSWIGDAGGNEARTEDNFGIYLQRSSGTSMVYISWAAIGRWK